LILFRKPGTKSNNYPIRNQGPKPIVILIFHESVFKLFCSSINFPLPIRIAVVVWTLCLGDVTIRYISHAKHLLPLVILWGRHQLKRYFHCSYWWILPNIALGHGLYEVITYAVMHSESRSDGPYFNFGILHCSILIWWPPMFQLHAIHIHCSYHVFYFSCNYLFHIGLFSTTNFQGDSTSSVAPKTNVAKYESPKYAREPCFARPARKESTVSNLVVQPITKMQGYDFDSLEPPSFARPSKQIRQGEQLNNEKRIHHSEIGN